MSKLNITKGEVWVKNSRVQEQKTFSIGCGGWEICTTYTDFEEDKANAELIADAFNTANKCDMLPSELLAQRDELLEMLSKALNIYGRGYKPKENVEDTIGSNLYKDIDKLINKCNEK